MEDVCVTPGGSLLAVSDGGILLRSDDWGESWDQHQTETEEHLWSLYLCPDSGRLHVSGDGGVILVTQMDVAPRSLI